LLKENDIEQIKANLRDEIANEISKTFEQEKAEFQRQKELERQKFESEKSEQLRHHYLQEQQRFQEMMNKKEQEIRDLKNSEEQNQNLVRLLNNQLNTLKEEKHQATQLQFEMEKRLEAKAHEIALQKQRDLDEMNKKLLAIQQ
jgi:hypothetical protein